MAERINSYRMKTVNVQFAKQNTRVFSNQEYKVVREIALVLTQCVYPFSALVLLSFDSSTVFFIDTSFTRPSEIRTCS